MVCCFCFPPSAKVLTADGYIAIGNIKKGDKFLFVRKGGQIGESEFCTYLHYDPQLIAEFLVLRCANGAELTISNRHLLHRVAGEGKAKPVPAQDIAVGDSLVFVGEQKQRAYTKVVEVHRKTITGAFAPLTESGTLIVDGFHASCYAEVGSHKLAHAAMAPLRFWCRYRYLNLAKPTALNAPHEIHSYARALTSLYSAVRPE